MEEWRDIQGYEGLYQVSNAGRVKRLLKSNQKGRILSLTEDKDGYLRAHLSKNNSALFHSVHRLVATAFIQNPDGFPLVNHRDENKSNNNVENLEWCTAQYNTRYKNAHLKKPRKPIFQMNLDGEVIKEWSGRTEIEKSLGYHGGTITACCLKYPHCLTAYGYKWAYKES